jgi:Glycosyl transferase family 11
MIITKIRGGLGNQLFQYAVGRRLAHDLKTVVKVDIGSYGNQPLSETVRTYEINKFNAQVEIASPEEVEKLKNPYGIFSKLIRYANLKLNDYYTGWFPNVLKKKGDIYLDGYWKNENYFKPIEDIIRKELTLKAPLSEKAIEIKNIILATPNPVSFHIRRGDYASSAIHLAHFGLMPLEYYQKASDLLKSQVPDFTPFIFSDDIDWVKKNMQFDTSPVYVSQPGMEACEELMLMSYCKHNIIANSSFSWWGAWLNNHTHKIVIAPERWLAKTGNDYYKEIPESWLKI